MNRPILLAAVTVAAAFWVNSAVQATAVHADTQPAETVTTEAPVEPKIAPYIVQRGEYLDKIAKQHNISWPSIYELNAEVSNPDIIYTNQELKVPDQDIPLTRQLPQESVLRVPDSYQPKVAVKATKPTTTATIQGSKLNVGLALSFVGYPYRYGGTTPAGFDCSGFTQYIAAQQGVRLSRTVMGQFSGTARISKGDLQAGDLVFFNAHHVGIYIGGGNIVHAATPALGVRIDSLSSAIAYNGYLGAGRL